MKWQNISNDGGGQVTNYSGVELQLGPDTEPGIFPVWLSHIASLSSGAICDSHTGNFLSELMDRPNPGGSR